MVAAVPPKVTELVPRKWTPMSVTLVPPVVRPVFGETKSISGRGGAV